MRLNWENRTLLRVVLNATDSRDNLDVLYGMNSGNISFESLNNPALNHEILSLSLIINSTFGVECNLELCCECIGRAL